MDPSVIEVRLNIQTQTSVEVVQRCLAWWHAVINYTVASDTETCQHTSLRLEQHPIEL